MNSTVLPAAMSMLPWQLLDGTMNTDIDAQLAGDEAMLERVANGEKCGFLRTWTSGQCLVATRREARMPGFATACHELAGRGWPVTVRRSGGSCVPNGPGVLNLSMAYPAPSGWDIDDSYRLLCWPLRELLNSYGLHADFGEVPGAFCDGTFNLQVDGRKLVGTAQRWRRRAVLAHACVLVDLDLDIATAMINELYLRCASSQRFDTGACATLAEQAAVLCARPAHGIVADASNRLDKILAHCLPLASNDHGS